MFFFVDFVGHQPHTPHFPKWPANYRKKYLQKYEFSEGIYTKRERDSDSVWLRIMNIATPFQTMGVVGGD